MEKIGYCKKCGKKFVRKHAPEKYCSDVCRDTSRVLQNRKKSMKYYHRHKHEMDEKQRWGLGSGYLGHHRNKCFEKEHVSVRNEFRRLKLR